MNAHKILTLTLLTIMIGICQLSCKKFVEINPPDNLVTSVNTFNNDATALSVMSGLYSEMMRTSSLYSSGYTSLTLGLSADEYNYLQGVQWEEFSLNQITQTSHGTIDNSFWQPLYNHIYTANIILENLAKTDKLSVNVKNQLLAEAKFIRAFAYFYLVNIFGDVPLVLETNYHNTSKLARTSVSSVYDQIDSDLNESLQSFNLLAGQQNIRPGKWAVKALQARVALYREKFDVAIALATEVIANSGLVLETDLNNVFLRNSKETIWQLKPVNPSYNTWEAVLVNPATANSTPTYVLTKSLLNSLSANDNRKSQWTKSRVWNNDTIFYNYKYKSFTPNAVQTENYVVLRLAEIYLIRAEARVRKNNLDEAKQDINMIRNRSGMVNTNGSTSAEILSAIEEERRHELFGEWGNRWFDLKRTGKINSILGPLKPNWQATDALWPIPNAQLKANPALVQNPGY